MRRSNQTKNAFADSSKRSASRQGRDHHRLSCRAQTFRRGLSLRCNLPLDHFPCRAVDSLPRNAGKGVSSRTKLLWLRRPLLKFRNSRCKSNRGATPNCLREQTRRRQTRKSRPHTLLQTSPDFSAHQQANATQSSFAKFSGRREVYSRSISSEAPELRVRLCKFTFTVNQTRGLRA